MSDKTSASKVSIVAAKQHACSILCSVRMSACMPAVPMMTPGALRRSHHADVRAGPLCIRPHQVPMADVAYDKLHKP